MRKRLSFVLVIITALSTPLWAQNAAFTASAPSQVQLGRQFYFQITGSEKGTVQWEDMKGFSLLGGPSTSFSSNTQIINGKRTHTANYTMRYVLRADEIGEHIIPALTIKSGRKEYRTKAVRVKVLSATTGDPSGSGSADPGTSSASQGEDIFLRIVPEKREVFVGEQFTSDLRIYFRVQTSRHEMGEIPYEGFYKTMVDADAQASEVDVRGSRYVTQAVQRHILIPQKSGTITLPAYSSQWTRRVRDPYSFFGYRDVADDYYTRPVNIKVKALPSGAPDGFSGAVGDFQMKASLSESEVAVNDALSLKVSITGSGNLSLIGEPGVKLPPDHDLFDVTRKVSTSTAGNRISGSVVFEYPIIVRHAGSYRIPPIEFSWFDPARGEYRTRTSQGFEFRVLKGEGDEQGPGAYVPGVSQEQVRDLGRDIRDIRRGEQRFYAPGATIMGSGWYGLSYLLGLLLFALVLLLLTFVARRNADISLVRNRKAGKEARKRLRRAENYRKEQKEEAFYEEVSRSLWLYLEDKLNMGKTDISMEGIRAELERREIHEDPLSDLETLLNDCEFARFAPVSEKPDMAEMYDRAGDMITLLEKTLK